MTTNLSDGAQSPVLTAGSDWTATPLIDLANLKQWTEDLSHAQVYAILQQVPLDSRTNTTDLLAAAGRGDLVASRRLAHRLKGMAAGIGAGRLAEVARAIEQAAAVGAEIGGLVAALPEVLDDTLVALGDLKLAS